MRADRCLICGEDIKNGNFHYMIDLDIKHGANFIDIIKRLNNDNERFLHICEECYEKY